MRAVDAALDSLRAGKPVFVTDSADRENEGDVILAADRVTSDWVAWTVRNTSGLLCAPMTGARADALELPQMVSNNQDPKQTAYTVTVDAALGVTTGISASDRARTLRVLASADTVAADLIRPGHVLPLRARPGGVLERPGHIEAAVDLCASAGLPAVGVIAELLSDNGSMMRYPAVEALGRQMGLPVLTIDELVAYRRMTKSAPAPERARVERIVETVLPTQHGEFRMIGYLDHETGAEHVALVRGTLGLHSLARVHSECLTGESLASQRCECGPQLSAAMERIGREGGVVVYLRGHEGRGIGLVKKLAAYRLQDQGFDTVAANLELGESADGREYGGGAAILRDLGLSSVQLLTNNPAKVSGLEAHGIEVSARLPLLAGVAPGNIRYLQTKRNRMGHLLPAQSERSS